MICDTSDLCKGENDRTVRQCCPSGQAKRGGQARVSVWAPRGLEAGQCESCSPAVPRARQGS